MQNAKRNLKRQNNIKQTINNYNTRYKNRKRSKRSKEIKTIIKLLLYHIGFQKLIVQPCLLF